MKYINEYVTKLGNVFGQKGYQIREAREFPKNHDIIHPRYL
jgi:hypothetical protein